MEQQHIYLEFYIQHAIHFGQIQQVKTLTTLLLQEALVGGNLHIR